MKSESGIKVGDTVIWRGLQMTVWRVAGKRAYCRSCIYIGNQIARKKVKGAWFQIAELGTFPSDGSKYPTLYRSMNGEVIRKRVQGMTDAQLINETRAKLKRERAEYASAATSLLESAPVVWRQKQMEWKERQALLEQMKVGSAAFERERQQMLADTVTLAEWIASLLWDQALKESAACVDEEQWRARMHEENLEWQQRLEQRKQEYPEATAHAERVHEENLRLERQSDQIRAERKEKIDELEQGVARLEKACDKWEPECSSEDRPKLEYARAFSKRACAELAQMRAEENSFWERMRARYQEMRPEWAVREDGDMERRELHQIHLELKKRHLMPA